MNDRAGQIPVRAVMAAALGLWALPATAMAPPAPCQWDASAQRLVTVVDGVYAADMADAFPVPVGDGFVSFSIYPAAMGASQAEWLLLQHCPSGQELLIALPAGETRPFHDAYEGMVMGDTPYTMRQIGEEMAALGASARRTQNEFGSCGCDHLNG
jgi:hypothetical protein